MPFMFTNELIISIRLSWRSQYQEANSASGDFWRLEDWLPLLGAVELISLSHLTRRLNDVVSGAQRVACDHGAIRDDVNLCEILTS